MDRGPRIAQAALSLVGKDSSALVRAADLPAALAYYRSTSTCALTVLKAWAIAGCEEPEVTAAYYPGRVGKAFMDMIAVAVRFGAWVPGVKSPPLGLMVGDSFVITSDSRGADAHVGICVGEGLGQTMDAPFETVEGGQADAAGGSTAIARFTRHFVRGPDGLWRMGARQLFGVIRAFSLPVPDSNAS